MSKVFVDTVGFLAHWDTRDQWHGKAVAAFGHARQNRMELISSRFVFLERGSASARKPYRDLVLDFMESMEKDGTLLSIPANIWDRAWERYHLRHANGAGIVDQISFLLMEELEIKAALTNDDHFRAAGFETLM